MAATRNPRSAKQWAVRFGVVTSTIALGAFAVAQSQRGKFSESETDAVAVAQDAPPVSPVAIVDHAYADPNITDPTAGGHAQPVHDDQGVIVAGGGVNGDLSQTEQEAFAGYDAIPGAEQEIAPSQAIGPDDYVQQDFSAEQATERGNPLRGAAGLAVPVDVPDLLPPPDVTSPQDAGTVPGQPELPDADALAAEIPEYPSAGPEPNVDFDAALPQQDASQEELATAGQPASDFPPAAPAETALPEDPSQAAGGDGAFTSDFAADNAFPDGSIDGSATRSAGPDADPNHFPSQTTAPDYQPPPADAYAQDAPATLDGGLTDAVEPLANNSDQAEPRVSEPAATENQGGLQAFPPGTAPMNSPEMASAGAYAGYAAVPQQPASDGLQGSDPPVAPAASEPAGPSGPLPGSAEPGPRELEGPQSPQLVVQKVAPSEVQVGRIAEFKMLIRNAGSVAAKNVVVVDQIPRSARLVKTHPQARQSANGGLTWDVGTVAAGQEVTIEMHVEPTSEGRIGSTAMVTFQTAATAAIQVTKPRLTLEHTGPRQTLIGEMVRFAIRLTNEGTGVAENVIIEEEVPIGLSHTAGRRLEYKVGALQPGETKNLELTLKAAQAGSVENILNVRADGDIHLANTVHMEVVAPELRLKLDGPQRRFLNRTADYTIAIENPGTADAHDVDLQVQLPNGLRFVNTNNSGQYDSSTHVIQWNLASLPAKKRGRVQFTVMPKSMGDQAIRATAKAQLGLSDTREHMVRVDGVPALYFGVADVSDPIEVGENTVYEIRVVNQGTKAATQVGLEAELPEGLEAVDANGPSRADVQPRRVVFAPLAQLAPQQEVKFRVDVKGNQAGDWRFTVNVTSAETNAPVTKQESTHVYADQ